jgi:hypothetical protein
MRKKAFEETLDLCTMKTARIEAMTSDHPVPRRLFVTALQ